MVCETKNELMCSWCGRIKDETDTWILPVDSSDEPPDPSVSHGVCDDCYDEKLEEIHDTNSR